MTANEQNSARLDMWRRTARGVGGVALVFSLVVGVLLTVDWMRAGQAQTVRSDKLGQVLASARQAPADSGTVALAREMDRLERRAYFRSVTFQNTGVWMLVSSLLLAMACLHAAARLGQRIDDPRRFPATNQARADREARLALLVAGVGGMLLLAVWAVERAPPAPPPQAVAPVAKTNTAVAVPTARVAATMAPDPSGGFASPWCCFRGPRVGVATWAHAPAAWDGKSGAGVSWRTPLAKPGVSSPVLWGGKVFLTVGDEEAREVVAYDASTGAELWRQVVADGGPGESLPQTSTDTGLGASTPACDESAVYAVFGTGDLVAYTHEGRRLWQRYLSRPDNTYGHASSLWVEDGKVCVQYDQTENGRVLVLDAKNGKTIWEQARTQGPAWCSPVVVAGADGRPALVANGQGTVDAYDLDTGRQLWSVEGVTGEVAPSPACANGRIFVANAGARLVCYQLAGSPAKAWEYTGVLPDVASPVAAGGLVFLAASSGELACVDAADGKELWQHEYSTGFYASPIVCGDRVYALDREGTMRIFAAARAFREVASCRLDDSADATPAFADGSIFIRTRRALWRLGGK